MALEHLYLLVENTGLTEPQKDTFVDALKGLVSGRGNSPFEKLQPYPIRPDNQAVILEGMFDTSETTPLAIRQFLAKTFSIPANTITRDGVEPDFGKGTTVVNDIKQGGVSKIRLTILGGPNATWDQSREEAAAYLAQNRSEWFPEEVTDEKPDEKDEKK